MIVNLKKAVELIKNGEIVAIPTETVYGLAADAFNVNAVKKTFDRKGRPPDNPLIVHINNLKQLDLLVTDLKDEVQVLAEKFWPGPLSLVLKKKNRVPDIVTGGLDTVAVRMPDHPLTLSLIEQTGPLTAPSANKSGRPSPTNPKHIIEDFGDSLPILDGGSTKIGLESTVLDMSGETFSILRPGFVSAEMIEEILGESVIEQKRKDHSAKKRSPGTRYTHYKPKASVQWLEETPLQIDTPENYYILHGEHPDQTEEKNIHSYRDDYEALARDLFDHFRTADHLSYSKICVEPFKSSEHHPLISALIDRIEKAIGS